MVSYEPIHMVVPVLADQQELIYNSSAKTQDVVLKTCWEWWMTETDGERESGKFVLSAQCDDASLSFIWD